MDHQLPPDVLDHVAQFLPVGDALRLMRVSRILNATVRYCWPLWRGVAAARCPFSAGVALKAQQQHLAEHGQDAEIDWVALLASSSRRRYGQITPFPCGAASRADGVFAKLIAALQYATESLTSVVAQLVDHMFGEGTEAKRVVFVGLDAAGKTTILYRLKLGKLVQTTPSNSVNVETIATASGSAWEFWDLGGGPELRPIWRDYFMGALAHVFVIDASNKERMRDAVRACLKLRHRHCDLYRLPLLVMANKQDVDGALSVEQIASALVNEAVCPLTGMWCVQGVSAVSGKGLVECLEWLAWAVLQPLQEASRRDYRGA